MRFGIVEFDRLYVIHADGCMGFNVDVKRAGRNWDPGFHRNAASLAELKYWLTADDDGARIQLHTCVSDQD